jgi:hypothetical protein
MSSRIAPGVQKEMNTTSWVSKSWIVNWRMGAINTYEKL